MTETQWDAGATTWDTALGLPDGRTIWDRIVDTGGRPILLAPESPSIRLAPVPPTIELKPR